MNSIQGNNIKGIGPSVTKSNALGIAKKIMDYDNDTVDLSTDKGEVVLKKPISFLSEKIIEGVVNFDPDTKEINNAHFKTDAYPNNSAHVTHEYTITTEDKANCFSKLMGKHKDVMTIEDAYKFDSWSISENSITKIELDPKTHEIINSYNNTIPSYYGTGGAMD